MIGTYSLWAFNVIHILRLCAQPVCTLKCHEVHLPGSGYINQPGDMTSDKAVFRKNAAKYIGCLCLQIGFVWIKPCMQRFLSFSQVQSPIGKHSRACYFVAHPAFQ